MPVLLDACVLYPTVMREILLGCADQGLFHPRWSARILEEWARAAGRRNKADEVFARGEITLLRVNWPDAVIPENADLLASLYLPDPDDIHVLGAAITGGCTTIITMNLKDFPRKILDAHGVCAQHPDAFLRALCEDHPGAVQLVANRVRARAEQLSGAEWPLRKLMKKARLPRLGKALEIMADQSTH